MKYWVLRIGAVLCAALLLTGCGTARSAPPVTDGFVCRAAMQYREMAVEGELTCTTDGAASLSFTLPKSLQGIALHWDGRRMAMELGNMSLEVPSDKVPESALIRCMLSVLTAVHPTGSLTEEGYVIEGEAEGTAYRLVCDPTSGLPLSLSVPSQELEAVFTDMTRLQDPTP